MLRQILFAFCFVCSAWASSLQWSAGPVDAQHGAPTGFEINWGLTPGIYTVVNDAGLALQWAIPADRETGYFAVTAYRVCSTCPGGLPECYENELQYFTCKSGYSNEVFYRALSTIGARSLRASKHQTGEAPMSINPCSPGYTIINNSDGSYSGAVSVPSDCDFAVMLFLGYSTDTRTVSACTLGGTAMTVQETVGTANETDRWIYTLPAPATGSQTFVINHNGSFLAGGMAALVWLKGVAQTSYKRDSDNSYGSSSATTQQLTMTSVSGDFGIIFGGGDSGTAYNVDIDSQTKLEEPAAYNGGLVGLAYKYATGTTLTMSGYGTFNGVAAIVLIPAAGAAVSINVADCVSPAIQVGN